MWKASSWLHPEISNCNNTRHCYADENEDDLESELEEAGLDIDELDMMDEDERAQALEDAGLDPDDWDE